MAVAAHYLSLVLGAVVLAWLGRNQWFFADDWEFIADRGLTGHPALGLFVPHTQHWTTGPIIIWRGLLNVFGLHSYIPFLLTAIAVHLVVVHLIWRVAGRAHVGDWTRTAGAALFMVAASNGTNAMWAFQITLNGTIAIGLGILLLVESNSPMSRPRFGAVIALSLVMVTFSSIAIPMMIAVGVLVLIRHGWRQAMICVLPAAVAFGSWYMVIGRKPLPGNSNVGIRLKLSGSLLEPATRFLGHGVAVSIGAPYFLGVVVSMVLLIGLIAWSVSKRRILVGRAAGATSAALAGIVFFALAAVGRATSVQDAPTQPRYLYVAGALLLPLVMVCLDSFVRPLVRRWRIVGPLLLVGVAVLGYANVAKLRHIAHHQSAIEQILRSRILDAASQIRTGEPYIAGSTPEPQFTIDLQMDELAKLVSQGWVPATPPYSKAEVPEVRIQDQIGLGTHPEFDGAGSVNVIRHPGIEVTATGDTCDEITKTTRNGSLALRVDKPGSLEVITPGPVIIKVHLASVRGGRTLATRTLITSAGTNWLDLATTDNLVVIEPQVTALRICGLRTDMAGAG